MNDGARERPLDCTKIETCGDSIVDDSEQCDDGNENPIDSCDTCATTTWTTTPLTGGIGLAAMLALAQPTGVAFDRFGTMYIADSAMAQVFQVTRDGIATVIAGLPGGRAQSDGDGGPASSAHVFSPTSVDALTVFASSSSRPTTASVRRSDAVGGSASVSASQVAARDNRRWSSLVCGSRR